MTNLRFGIRPFEFEDFFRMIEQGKLDISRVSYVEVARASLQDSFKHFEVTADLAYVLPGLLSAGVIDEITDFKMKNGYSCSVHLPLWSIELASPNNYTRNASIDCLVEAIELTKSLDPICWVIHATGALVSEFIREMQHIPRFATDFMNNQFVTTAQDSLEQIIDRTNLSPRKLAVENVEFPFQAMEECIETLNLSVCFDTGHLLAGYSGEWENGVFDFFETYNDRIIELHLHDGRKPRIDHKTLGRYDLPVRDLLLHLIGSNFSGPIVFELSLEEVKESMAYIKENVPEALS